MLMVYTQACSNVDYLNTLRLQQNPSLAQYKYFGMLMFSSDLVFEIIRLLACNFYTNVLYPLVADLIIYHIAESKNVINVLLENWESVLHVSIKIDTNFATTFFTIKLASCILLLILLKGGVPRYRYDYLTKIGWIRFLAWTLTIFLVVLTSTLIF